MLHNIASRIYHNKLQIVVIINMKCNEYYK